MMLLAREQFQHIGRTIGLPPRLIYTFRGIIYLAQDDIFTNYQGSDFQ